MPSLLLRLINKFYLSSTKAKGPRFAVDYKIRSSDGRNKVTELYLSFGFLCTLHRSEKSSFGVLLPTMIR